MRKTGEKNEVVVKKVGLDRIRLFSHYSFLIPSFQPSFQSSIQFTPPATFANYLILSPAREMILKKHAMKSETTPQIKAYQLQVLTS